MKYVSLDLETTSLVPHEQNILMVGMIVEDSNTKLPREECPQFSCIVKRKEYCGQPYALAMNSWILDMLAGRTKTKYHVYTDEEWQAKAHTFLDLHFGKSKINLAGKNAGPFDLQFLPASLKSRFSHRIIDPGSMFIDWKNDKRTKSLDQIKELLKIKGEVTHDALDDAWDVIKILRTQY